MSVRKSILVLAFAAFGISAAHAQATSTWVGGEAGFVDRPVQSTLSRDEVRQALLSYRANPVAADGARLVGGEVGDVAEQHAFARVDGQWVCIDKIAHNAKPDAVRTAAERRAFRELYPA